VTTDDALTKRERQALASLECNDFTWRRGYSLPDVYRTLLAHGLAHKQGSHIFITDHGRDVLRRVT